MASRREFLQAGIAVSLLPVAAAADTSPQAFQPMPLYKVIFDQRFPAGREFAAEAGSLALPVHGIDGDITDLWFHDLSLRWKQESVAIAGLTAHGPLFCLERLAWDHRMRVVFRASHSLAKDKDGSMEHALWEHALWGPAEMLREASPIAGGADWARAIASLLARCPENRSEPCSTTIRMTTGSAAVDQEPLYSWVIAPRNQNL